ncbi:MAG: hypothetical protein RML94_04590, partial [Bacteroidia bacterium]|nr:hypothetical protein [Bacteroidia bacterium]
EAIAQPAARRPCGHTRSVTPTRTRPRNKKLITQIVQNISSFSIICLLRSIFTLTISPFLYLARHFI